MADTSLWVISPGGGPGTTTSINFTPFPATLVSNLPSAQLQATDNGAFAATVQLNTLGNNSGNPPSSLLQPRQTWNTNGSIAFPTMPNVPATGTADLTIDAKGNVAPQTSSARFKADIQPLCDDFHRILALQPKQFQSVITGDRGIGYIAEDVAALSLDDLVSLDDAGEPLSVHYKLIPMYMLEVLKMHERTIAALREDVALLRAKLT